MTVPTAAGRPPYHHGDLHNALVQAAIGLAREGGRPAIVLREAARRVGVSPTAAYRHFSSLPALVDAVTVHALAALARSMEAELARCPSSDDSREEARDHLRATGRGYVRFALAEPGLFAVAFSHQMGTVDLGLAKGDSGLLPRELLERCLDELLAVGDLAPEGRDAAATAAWAAVHGLSLLLLGPMSGTAPSQRELVIEQTLDLCGRGIFA